MKTYRRIEVNAFHRRVTIVSSERPREISDSDASQTDDRISLTGADSSEPVSRDSAEDQLPLKAPAP